MKLLTFQNGCEDLEV